MHIPREKSFLVQDGYIHLRPQHKHLCFRSEDLIFAVPEGYLAISNEQTGLWNLSVLRANVAAQGRQMIVFEDSTLSIVYQVEGNVRIDFNTFSSDIGSRSVWVNGTPEVMLNFDAGSTVIIAISFSKESFLAHGITGDLMQELTASYAPLFVYPLEHKTVAILSELFDAPVDPISRELYLQSRIYELLRVYRAVSLPVTPEAVTAGKIKLMEDIRAHIHRHFAEQLTIRSISQAFGINGTDLKQAFHHLYRQTLHQYLFLCRMEHATYLLLHTDKAVGEISVLSGYNDFSSFSRAFHAHMKMSPSAYRKSQRLIC